MEVVSISWPEAVVEQRFAEFLTGPGWQVSTKSPDYLDLLATRDGERLVAEIKGHMKYSSIDADVLFGQILRRMNDLSGATRYAIVIPEPLLSKIERVPADVRAPLKLETWVVPAEGDPYQA